MAKFIYHGPVQELTLKSGKKDIDVAFFPGRETDDLDPAHPVIATMIETGILSPVPATAKSKTEK